MAGVPSHPVAPIALEYPTTSFTDLDLNLDRLQKVKTEETDDGWEDCSDTEPEEAGGKGEAGGAPKPTVTQERCCATCNKPSTPAETLKRCGRYHQQWYCSPNCQASDWGSHKSKCKKPPQNQEAFPAPLNGFLDGSILHYLPERQAFLYLIECYRLRVEDEYVFQGEAGGLYGGYNPLPEFRRFLNKAQRKKGILPSWWSPQKKRDCESLATSHAQINIQYATEKSDVQEYWKDNLMPMKLRMLAEKIYGTNVYGH